MIKPKSIKIPPTAPLAVTLPITPTSERFAELPPKIPKGRLGPRVPEGESIKATETEKIMKGKFA